MKLFASFVFVLVLFLVHDSTAHPRPFFFHDLANIIDPHDHGKSPSYIIVPPYQQQQTIVPQPIIPGPYPGPLIGGSPYPVVQPYPGAPYPVMQPYPGPLY